MALKTWCGFFSILLEYSLLKKTHSEPGRAVMSGEPATAVSSVDGSSAVCPRGPRRADSQPHRLARPHLPAEAPHAIGHEPHPPLLWRLRCEVAGSKEQGRPHSRDGEHLLPQGLWPPGPGGTQVHGPVTSRVTLPRCRPLLPPACMALVARAGLAPQALRLCEEPLQATLWSVTRVLSGHYVQVTMPGPNSHQETSGWRK